MPPRRIVIGIVGGHNAKQETLKLAKALGAEVARQGCILLTGGRIVDWHLVTDVKDAAMAGASEAERGDVIARLIGILPSGTPDNWPAIGVNRLFLETGLTSKERDLINGATPDAIIALNGGDGTLCELGFALAAKRNVLFANSIEALSDSFKKKESKLRDYFDEALAKYPALPAFGVTTENLIKQVQGALLTSKDEEGSVADVIEKAINSARSRSSGEFGFPGLPGDPESRRKFERLLRHLCN